MSPAARRRTLAVVLPIVATAGLLGWLAVRGGGWTGDGEQRWQEVVEAPFVRRIPAGGELRSASPVTVGCPPIPRKWNFQIKFLVPEGTEVREGQPVVGFDAQDVEERLRVTRSKLDTARSRLERTRIQQREAAEVLVLERAEAVARAAKLDQQLEVPEQFQQRIELEKLRLDKELADEELRLIDLRVETQQDNTRALIRTAETRVAKLEREIAETRAAVEAHQVRAPRAGFVVHQTNWQGDKPKVGETIWIGQQVLEIADLDRMELVAEVAERDARWVAVGQRVEVRLDAAPERTFTGEIRELGRLFREKSDEVPKMIFDAVIAVEDPDAELMRPGMAASVDILAPTDTRVIQIPESAVRLDDGRTVVTVRRGGVTLNAVSVELGARWEGSVVVRDGLAAGDRVAVLTGEAG